MAKARVKIWDRPMEGCEPKLLTEFVTEGITRGLQSTGCAYLFAFAVDYSGLPHENNMPRAKQAYPIFAYDWDWKTRRGRYFSAPYGGRIEITAA